MGVLGPVAAAERVDHTDDLAAFLESGGNKGLVHEIGN